MPKMNMTIVLARDYENKRNWTLGQIKPNLPNAENPVILPNFCMILSNFYAVFANFCTTFTNFYAFFPHTCVFARIFPGSEIIVDWFSAGAAILLRIMHSFILFISS